MTTTGTPAGSNRASDVFWRLYLSIFAIWGLAILPAFLCAFAMRVGTDFGDLTLSHGDREAAGAMVLLGLFVVVNLTVAAQRKKRIKRNPGANTPILFLIACAAGTATFVVLTANIPFIQAFYQLILSWI